MKVQLPILNHEAQQRIFNSKARFVIVPKGRRFGLTRGAANDFILCALNETFKRGLWVDTVNSNIERYVERYFLPALQKLPEEHWGWRKQQKILRIGGAFIDFRSADTPETLEGFDYDKAFLNEAGIILRNEYLWYNAIKPMLWDRKCRTVVGGTPKGRGLFETLYMRGLDPDQVDYESFKFSSFDNPYAPHELIMDDLKAMPERVAKQEIYAEFLDDTGIVFRGVSQIATGHPEDPVEGHLYVIGCDLAKVQDYTVIAVYDRSNNHQVFQMRFNKLEWAYQKQKIQEVSRKYNNALILIDSTGIGEPIYEDLARAGVPIEPIHLSNESKKQMIEKLATWIELKYCRMLQLDETIQELNSFTYDISEKTGRIMYNAPVGFHDDIVIAHALAVKGLSPLLQKKETVEMTVIQKDIYEKRKQFEDEQNGTFDVFDYDAI